MKKYLCFIVAVVFLSGCAMLDQVFDGDGEMSRSDIADYAGQITLWEWYERPGGEAHEALNTAIAAEDSNGIRDALLEFRRQSAWLPTGAESGDRYSQFVLQALRKYADLLSNHEIDQIVTTARRCCDDVWNNGMVNGAKQMTFAADAGLLYLITGEGKYYNWANNFIDTNQTAGALEGSQHYADIGGTSLLISSEGREYVHQANIEALCRRLIMTSTVTKYPWGREWWSLREPGNNWWMTRLLVAMQLVDNPYYRGQLKRVVRQSFQWLENNNYTIPVAAVFFDGWDEIDEDDIPDGIYCENNPYGKNSTKARQQYERDFWRTQEWHKDVVTMKYQGWFCALYNAWLVGKGDRGNAGALLALNGPDGDPLLQPRRRNIYHDPEENQSVAVTGRDPVNGRVVGTAYDATHAWIGLQADGWSRDVNLYFDGPRFKIEDTGRFQYVIWHILWDDSMEIVSSTEIVCQGMRWRFEAARVEMAERRVAGFYSDRELEVKLYGGRVVTHIEED